MMQDQEPTPSRPGPASPPWGAVLRCVGVEAALSEIARWLDPDGAIELRAEPERPGEDPGPLRARVPGAPTFWVEARRGGAPDRALADRAAAVLEAWRASRLTVERAAARVEARAKDLESLQALSRSLSERRTPPDLLAASARALHERIGADAVGWVGAVPLGGAAVHLARPLGEAGLRALVEAGRRGLDAYPGGSDGPAIAHLDAFDAARGSRDDVDPRDVLVLPVTRRGATVAHLVVLTADRPGERALRFLYGAVNHLALHLDRVLTVAEAEQGRFRSILDAMSQAVVLTDPRLRVVQANVAGDLLLERLGVATGAPLERIGALDLDALRRAAGGGPVPGAETRLDRGERLSVSLSPLRDSAGRVEGLVIVVDDVTESRRMLDQLAQAEKLSSLGRMLSGVAHELNNPLTSVLGFSQMARSTPPGEKLDRRLQLVHDEARRCQKIVQNLLRFARRHEPECRPFSLNEVVESAVQLLGYQLRVDGVAIELELDSGIPTLHGDAHEIQQVVVNLVTNAHQALKECGRGGRVVLRSRVAAGNVLFEVEDDGPGIPESIRTRVFDPFFTTKSAGQGTGLGLSLVYGTVTAHGGTIEAGERSGGGARFRIELPCGARGRADAPEPVPADAPPGAHPQILVVDDEHALAEMIRDALEHDGHDVVTACEAGAVLDRLESGAFDLVVSDLKMPGLGAERLWREIRERRPGLERRLLLTTGDTVSREPESFAARVGADLVHKPFAPDEIRRRVRTSLDRRGD